MSDKAYTSYVRRSTPKAEELLLMGQRLSTLADPPTISVLLAVSDPDEVWIKESASSVLEGLYPHVELCVCDNASERRHVAQTLEEIAASDGRVKVRRLRRASGRTRAFRGALSLARGRFVTLLGEGDTLAPEALFRVAELLQNVEADVVYADEDRVDVAGLRSDPVFKPYWSPDLLLSTMYVGRPCVIRTALVRNLGGFREDLEGAAEHDLLLRVAEKTSRVVHLPGVIYHRRIYERGVPQTDENAREAARRAVGEALGRRAVEAAVEPGQDPDSLRVIRNLSGRPSVSVVALASEPGSVERAQELARDPDYPVHEVIPAPTWTGDTPARAANLAAGGATGEYLLFVRDYSGATSPEWMVGLLRQAQRPEVGVVGGRVADADGNLRYAGSFLPELGSLIGFHLSVLSPDQGLRYVPVEDHPLNPHAVSADCMMVRRSVFEDAGGFDEEALPATFYDLDLSLRLGEKGLVNVYVPEAGVVCATDRPQPGMREIRLMWERWWPTLAKTLYYRDTPLRTAERPLDGDLLYLVSASV